MKIVAKAILIDKDGNYLLMKRSDHPTFPNDPDLPGGTLEIGEEPLQTMLREVEEEIGVLLDPATIEQKYAGDTYSAHRTVYHLYTAQVGARPEIIMSWEHSAYEWVTPGEFLEHAQGALDTYMRMVYDVIKGENTAK